MNFLYASLFLEGFYETLFPCQVFHKHVSYLFCEHITLASSNWGLYLHCGLAKQNSQVHYKNIHLMRKTVFSTPKGAPRTIST